MKFKTEKELLELTSKIKGKTFKEIDSEKLLESDNLEKEILNQIVETGFYKYPISDSKSNFEELKIKLVVIGYMKNKNGSLRAKERLVLGKINFNEIINETFETSNIFGKCKKMLIIWYEYTEQKEVKDYIITDYQLYDITKDKKIFENDFKIIREKILKGKAHELSEGDTSYLGACTETINTHKITQPFSDILTKPRTYSLKNAYMTGILRENIINPNNITAKSTNIEEAHEMEKIIIAKDSKQTTLSKFTNPPENKEPSHASNLSFNTVEEYVKYKLKPYFGKTQLEILKDISNKEYIDKVPKQISKMISDEILGKDKDLANKNELFTKTNFVIKNLPIKENGKPRERMSFKTISLSDFNEEWDKSYWKNYFEETTIITICYKEKKGSKNGYRILNDVKKITFNESDLESFAKTYNQIKKAIKYQDINLLPTSSNGFKNQLLEIAPKGIKGDDAYINFFKKEKTKVAFMISTKLLYEKIK